MTELLRKLAMFAGAICAVIGNTWARALYDNADELSVPAIFLGVAGAAVFARMYYLGTARAPEPELPTGLDAWDRGAHWLARNAAPIALLAIVVLLGGTYALIFGGETTGDDLTFHMAESRRLADCISAGDWDFWNPSANAGYASAYYYQVIPQLASALPAALFGDHLFWFQASLWFPHVIAPVCAYRGLRVMGASPWQAVFGAFAASYACGGSRWGAGADGTFMVGLYTQTWALAFLPLGLGHAVRYLTRGHGLAAAVAWGTLVFLCHPFASIGLCLGLVLGVIAHLLVQVVRPGFGRDAGIAACSLVAACLLVVVVIEPSYLVAAMVVLVVALGARFVTGGGRHWTLALLGGLGAGLIANAFGLATMATAFLGPLLLIAALGARLAFAVHRDRDLAREPVSYDAVRRLFVLGAALLVATTPGWLTVIVDRDGFGGFPHRVADEVGPGYTELARWFTSGGLFDDGRLPVLTWLLPGVVLLARLPYGRWLWAPAIGYAVLLALGPHMPTTTDDLLPAVRFLGTMQVVVALALGAGLQAIGAELWTREVSPRVVRLLFFGRPVAEARYTLRTVLVAAACAFAILVAISGAAHIASRIYVLTDDRAYGYRDEIMELNARIAALPQGRKQVGPGCENHWWNLLSYVYERRPSLLQMGGGGLQASPNYDFVWSVRDFAKLAWVYDVPLFQFARAKASDPSVPDGDVLAQTARYELRRLPAPGPVSAIEVTGSLPPGKSRAGNEVRKAAIDWLRSDVPYANKHLAYDGDDGLHAAPDATVVRAFHVDPSPGDLADLYADVEVRSATTFVARESWHPRWHAFVDGVEVPVRRVTPDFLAVDVAPGTHTIAFRFERPWWASAAWLLWPLVVLATWWLRRRREPACKA